MTKPLLFLSSSFLVLFIFVQPAFAGPWTKSVGEAYVKVGESGYFANGFVNADGDFQDGASYLGMTSSLYTEVGIWERLHVAMFLPYVVAVNSFDEARFLRGSGGDGNFALQWSPTDRLPWAVSVTTKVPFYDITAYQGPYGEFFPAPGDGQIDVTLGTSVGGPIGDKIFYSLNAGYQLRTNTYIGGGPIVPPGYKDTISFGGELGMTIVKPVVSLQLQSALPVESDTRTKGYIQGAVAAFVPFGSTWALEAGVGFSPWARNSSTGTSVSLGLSYRQ